MVDYENEDGKPQHAVLSWLDDEAKDLPDLPADGWSFSFAADGRALQVRQRGQVRWIDADSGKVLGPSMPDPVETGMADHRFLVENRAWRIAESPRWTPGVFQPQRWTDRAEGGVAGSSIGLFPHGAATPEHSFPVWTAAGQRRPAGVVVSADGTRMGYENRDHRGERQFEWHAVPGAADWLTAAICALLPTALVGLVSWRRGWLSIVPAEDEPPR